MKLKAVPACRMVACFVCLCGNCSSAGEIPKRTGANSAYAVDILCSSDMARGAEAAVRATTTNVRRYCGQWPDYFDLLDEHIVRGLRVVVMLPMALFSEETFVAAMRMRRNHFPFVLWVAQSEVMQGGNDSSYAICSSSFNAIVPDFKRADLKCPKCNYSDVGQIISHLSNARRKVMKSRESFREFPCTVIRFLNTWMEDHMCVSRLADALTLLNASCRYSSVPYEGWMTAAIRLGADAVDNHMMYNVKRSRHFGFTKVVDTTNLRCYVQKKMILRVNVVSYDAVSNMLAVVVASASMFVLFIYFLNKAEGRMPRYAMGHTVLAMLAGVLNLSPTYPRYLSSRHSRRLLLAFWALGMFFLSAYVQSLLTTGVSVGQRLDYDDTADKLVCKLRRGKLRACADPGSYVPKALSDGAVHSELMRSLHAALVMSAVPLGHRGNYVRWCLSMVSRGSHVLVTDIDLECNPEASGAVASEPRFGSQLVTMLVARDSPLKDVMASLVSRVFETGWPYMRCKRYPVFIPCRQREESDAYIRLDWKMLCALYIACCTAASTVLGLEMALQKCSLIGRQRSVRASDS